METPRAFLLRRHQEVSLAALDADPAGQPWQSQLALLQQIAEWEWRPAAEDPAELDGFAEALRFIAGGGLWPMRAGDPAAVAAFAAELLREWEERG